MINKRIIKRFLLSKRMLALFLAAAALSLTLSGCKEHPSVRSTDLPGTSGATSPAQTESPALPTDPETQTSPAPTDPTDPTGSSAVTPTETPDLPIPEFWCVHENTKKVADKAATCVADGYENRLKCEDCGLVLEATGTIIPACGHQYKERKCIYCDKVEPSVAAGGQFEGTKVIWQLFDDGELAITGDGAVPDFPTDENSYFFGFNKAVKSIVVYNGVTRIGDNAFRNLKETVTVSISSTVKEIGDHAFDGWALKTLNLSYGLEKVGRDNFTGNQIFFVDLPASMRCVGAGSFTSAQTVTLRVPNSVTVFEANEDQYYNFLNVAFEATEEQAKTLGLYRRLITDGRSANVKLHFKYTDKASKLPYCTKRSQTSGDFKYSVFTDNTAVITGYNGSSSTVTVPSTVGTYTVVAIEHEAFKKNTVIKKITLPETCREIGYDAFIDSGIQEVTLLADKVLVGSGAFSGCSSFKTMNFDGVFTDVGAKAFAGTYVKNITLSPEMKVARVSAFASSSIGTIDFTHFEIIADSAFAHAAQSGTVDLTGVREIGFGAFAGSSVKSLIVTNVGKIEHAAFADNTSLSKDKVVGLDTVGVIEDGAFPFKV